MLVKIRTTLACAVLFVGCLHRQPFTNAYAPMGRRLVAASEPRGDLARVSLSDLVASPERYHRSRVRVEGHVQFEFEGNTLCPDQKPTDWQACVWLDIEGLKDPGFRRARAVVEGTFDGENLGHLGIAGGTIERITLITRLK